jgi:hypothetical protein
MPALSGISMRLIRHQIPDIKRPIGNSVLHGSLPTLTQFVACKEDLSNMKKIFGVIEVRQAWRIPKNGNSLY